MYGYIYKTTNIINSKIYIGQKKSQFFLESKYLGSGSLLRKAVAKYGKQNFKVELVEECEDKKTLDQRERYWIEYYNARESQQGYNIATGGEGGGFVQHKHSPETKKRIAKSVSLYNQEHRKGKKMKDLFGDKYINGMKGKPAKNKGCLKIYNPELNKTKYIPKTEDIKNYPGYVYWDSSYGHLLNLDYLKNPEYIKQLKQRNKNTHHMYNDKLKQCRRIKDEDLKNFLENGWRLGRKKY